MNKWLKPVVFLFSLIGALVILSIYSQSTSDANESGQASIKNLLTSGSFATRISEQGDYVFEDTQENFTIVARYPKTDIVALDRDFEKFAQTQVDFFHKTLAQENLKESSSLLINYTTTRSDDYISFVFTLEESLGILSRIIYYKSFTYDTDGQYRSLGSIVELTPEVVEMIGARVEEDVRVKVEYEVSEGRMERALDATGRAFELFRIDQENIIFIIPSYKLSDKMGSAIEISLPLQELINLQY